MTHSKALQATPEPLGGLGAPELVVNRVIERHMSPEETLKQIKNWSPHLVQDVVDQLNQTGIVSDEDGQGFSSTWIEHWNDDCTYYFRRLGYQGGELFTHGKYFSDHGAVYALFDIDQHDFDSATDYLNEKAGSP